MKYKAIEHKGWLGEPYKSEYQAKWGVISPDDLFFGPEGLHNLGLIAEQARAHGKSYMVTPIGFIEENEFSDGRLYKIFKTHTLNVRRMLTYQRRNCESMNALYRTNSDARFRQIVRAAKIRSRNMGVKSDLDEDEIIARFRKGVCEMTGMPLNLTDIGHPFGPSLDQIVPQGGYITTNVQVVCFMFNQMKSNYGPEHVQAFVDHLRGG